MVETNEANPEYPVAVRKIQRYEEKNQICKFAAQFIQDGETVFVDNSSTAIHLFKYINRNIKVTIITNSAQALLEIAKLTNDNLTVICLGGLFRSGNFSMHGSVTLKNANEYYPNRSFVSCAGMTQNKTFTDNSIYEVDTKRFMIERSKENYVLADYTKFSSTGTVHLCQFSDIQNVITDSKTDRIKLDYLEGNAIHTYVAGS